MLELILIGLLVVSAGYNAYLINTNKKNNKRVEASENTCSNALKDKDTLVKNLTESIDKVNKAKTKLLQFTIQIREGESKIKSQEIDIKSLQSELVETQSNLEKLLVNQETYEKTYNAMISVIDGLYRYLVNKTQIGYFEDNWEIQELAKNINKSKTMLLNALRGEFTIENNSEIISAEEMDNAVQQAYINSQPKEVIAIVGSKDERNDKPRRTIEPFRFNTEQ